MIRLYAQGENRVEVVEEAKRWEEAGLISSAQGAAVRQRYRPDLVRVNLFIRILLAFFTAVGVTALLALPATLMNARETELATLFLLFAPLCAVVADRLLIHGRRLYRCGAEEILLFLAVLFLALAIGIFAHKGGESAERWGWLATHGILLAGATVLAIRYGYALAALGAVAALAALPFHLAGMLHWYEPGWSRVALFLLLGALALWTQWRLAQQEKLPRGYRWSLQTVRLAALTGIYLDVNLFAHRLLWLEWLGWMSGVRGSSWAALWVDPLCAALTALLPVVALTLGIIRRDRALLWYGILTAIASILTLKYFYHLGYLAEELTLAGLLLGGIAFALLRWLRSGRGRRRGPFTAEPLLEPRLYGLDAEALAAMQPLAPTPKVIESGGFQGGGGEFSGGGASGSY